MKKIHINNVPDWAYDRLCMTARLVDNEWWFYDAWDNDDRACNQACDEGLSVFYTERVE